MVEVVSEVAADMLMSDVAIDEDIDKLRRPLEDGRDAPVA